MLKISIYLKEEENQEIIGIKEDFAAYCEKFGDVEIAIFKDGVTL